MKQLIQCINEHNVTGFETNNAKRVKLYAQVSITAKPFFDKYGFSVVRENVVVIKGVELTNFIMENTETNKGN